jgi:hypothetical protein
MSPSPGLTGGDDKGRLAKMSAPNYFTVFGVTSWAWLMIIGETILMVFVNSVIFWLYKRLSPYKQFSRKLNKIALVFGLGCFSLLSLLVWLFSVRLLTSQ